jgi:hypothetical protein
MGEDRGRTERDLSRDRTGDEMVRLNVAEAAHRLGISEAGVPKRVQRGQIPHERDDAGRLFVWLSPGETRHTASRDDAEESRDTAPLVEEVRDRLRYVEGQLEAERQAHAETRRLLLSALEKIPPAIAPPSEAQESPSEATPHPGRAEPQTPLEGAQEPRESSEMHMPGPGAVHYPTTSRGPQSPGPGGVGCSVVGERD